MRPKIATRRACVVGHSYGTFVGSRLVQQHRDRVHTLCLIDPVCFGMFMPHLLHNFIVSDLCSLARLLALLVKG